MGGWKMKKKTISVRIKKTKPVQEDLFSNVKPNSQRKTPISNKKRMALDKRDKASRKRSASRRKKEDEVWLGTKQLMRIVEQELELYEKRKRKKGCGPGNPFHKKDGTWGNKDTSGGSWSLRQGKDDGDCSQGQTKYNKGSRPFTRIKCGRKDPNNPNVKAKYRCRDGKEITEQEEGNDEWVRIKKSALDNLLREYEGSLEIEPETIQEEGDTQTKIQNFCNRHKYHNIKQWLQHTNALELARDGKLKEPPKKSK